MLVGYPLHVGSHRAIGFDLATKWPTTPYLPTAWEWCRSTCYEPNVTSSIFSVYPVLELIHANDFLVAKASPDSSILPIPLEFHLAIHYFPVINSRNILRPPSSLGISPVNRFFDRDNLRSCKFPPSSAGIVPLRSFFPKPQILQGFQFSQLFGYWSFQYTISRYTQFFQKFQVSQGFRNLSSKSIQI